jgi:hypothetical protein
LVQIGVDLPRGAQAITMQQRLGKTTEARVALWVMAGRLLILTLPAVLLLAASLRYSGGTFGPLWLGTLFLMLAGGLAIRAPKALHQPPGTAVIMLYAIGLSWLLLGALGQSDWFIHFAQAALLVVALLVFASQCLQESGAPALRRARTMAARLKNRRDWPAELQACCQLPEVKALRDALQVDAAPALALLTDSRPQVRVAALAALEYRQNWRTHQPEVVLQIARQAAEPEVRAAAVNALANVEDRVLLESLSEFLHDTSALVRTTATEALLWNTEQLWPWIRLAVRRALADPLCQEDGALQNEGTVFPPEVVADLISWCSEKGVLAVRAALTLGAHFNQALALGAGLTIVEEMRRYLADVHAPVMLRLEVARVLYNHRELDDQVLRRLLDPSNPAPLRLIAVEALLNRGQSPEAMAALHDLARLPNREIALGIADVVQRRLGLDLGLPRGQPLPPLHSRQAADVARRVLAWANRQELPAEDDDVPDRSDETAWPTAL